MRRMISIHRMIENRSIELNLINFIQRFFSRNEKTKLIWKNQMMKRRIDFERIFSR